MKAPRNLVLVAVAFLLLLSLVARFRSAHAAPSVITESAPSTCPPLAPAPCAPAPCVPARIDPIDEAAGRVLTFGANDDIAKIEAHWADTVADLYLRHLRTLSASVHSYAPRYAREWRNMLWALVHITGEARADVRTVDAATLLGTKPRVVFAGGAPSQGYVAHILAQRWGCTDTNCREASLLHTDCRWQLRESTFSVGGTRVTTKDACLRPTTQAHLARSVSLDALLPADWLRVDRVAAYTADVIVEWELLEEIAALPDERRPTLLDMRLRAPSPALIGLDRLLALFIKLHERGYRVVRRDVDFVDDLSFNSEGVVTWALTSLLRRVHTTQPIVIRAIDPGWIATPQIRTCGTENLRCFLTDRLDDVPGQAAPAANFYLSEQHPSTLAVPKDVPSMVFTMEAKWYEPKWLQAGWRERFTVTSSFRLSSDVVAAYTALDTPHQWIDPRRVQQLSTLFYMNSNCKAGSQRDAYVQSLMAAGVSVHAFGQCLHNAEHGVLYPECQVRGSQRGDKFCIMSHYRYAIAFENVVEEDYATEKFYDALSVGSVPIVRGAPNIAQLAPHPESFIDANNMSPTALAQLLTQLEAEPGAYLRYHAWRNSTELRGEFKRLLAHNGGRVLCNLCTYIRSHWR